MNLKTHAIFIFLFFFLIISTNITAQFVQIPEFKYNYSPSTNYKIDNNSYNALIQLFKERTKQLKNDKTQKAKNYIVEVGNDMKSMFILLDSLNLLMYNDTSSKYLQILINDIVESNPCLKGPNYKVFIEKSNIPNASNLGEGIVFVHLDLLTKLKIESEIYFILFHELENNYKDYVK